MPKNNIKLLDRFELEQFLEKYSFESSGLFVIVKVKDFNRPTLQSKIKTFSISCKGRYLNITPEAIELWENYFQDKNLIEVQQAINSLLLMYQTPNQKDIAKILNDEI